jgi:hypothetical protein
MYCPLPTIHDDLETLRTRLRQTRALESGGIRGHHTYFYFLFVGKAGRELEL